MDDIAEKATPLFEQIEKLGMFETKYGLFPHKEAAHLAKKLRALGEAVPEKTDFPARNDVVQNELRRRLIGEACFLEGRLTGRRYDFKTLLNIYGISPADIEELGPWLRQNREITLDTIDRLFRESKDIGYELPLPDDIPLRKVEADALATIHARKYHEHLGKLLQRLTSVGEFLRDVGIVVTSKGRSYFNTVTRQIAVGVPAIVYITEDDTPTLQEGELIEIYGHEGMGHGLMHTLTKRSNLPFFLKKSSNLTIASEESATQFYERQIFEDINASPEAQRGLGITHKFPAIYRHQKDTEQVKEYKKRLFHYAITVLADKSPGEPKDPKVIKQKIEKIAEVSLDPHYAVGFVEGHTPQFDSEGNMSTRLGSEIRYVAEPVRRSLEIFRSKGMDYTKGSRSIIDETFLTGFWTPQGFIQNAIVTANQPRERN